jgi:hypothetical protein
MIKILGLFTGLQTTKSAPTEDLKTSIKVGISYTWFGSLFEKMGQGLYLGIPNLPNRPVGRYFMMC